MKNKYKLLKVFDCQDMPDNIRRQFFDETDHAHGNDVYIDFVLEDEDNSVVKWFRKHGADTEDEVVVKRWW
jgi:hypothetical protein